MESNSLQEAFEGLYKQSPAPIQLAVERNILYHSYNDNSVFSCSISNLLEKTLDCNENVTPMINNNNGLAIPNHNINNEMLCSVVQKSAVKPCQKLFFWIIKPVPLSDGICVEGKRSVDEEEYWHSGIVTERFSPRVIGTNSGSRYELIGEIELLDAVDAGIPQPLAELFKDGFPTNWVDLIDEYLSNNMEIATETSTIDQGTEELSVTTFVSQHVNRPSPNDNNNVLPVAVINGKETNQAYKENILVPVGIMTNGEHVNELCMEEEISVSESILSKTMVDKVLVQQNKDIPVSKMTRSGNLRSDNSESDKVPSEVINTQDKTPFSQRRYKLTEQIEVEDTNSQVETTDNGTEPDYDSSSSFHTAGTKQIDTELQNISTRESTSGLGKHTCYRSNENIDKSKRKIKSGIMRKSSVLNNNKSKNKDKIDSSSSADETEKTSVDLKSPTKRNGKSELVISLHDWIIRPSEKTKGVIVEGKKIDQVGYWRSSSIVDRKDQRTVVTDSGSIYKLVGNIKKLDTIDAGFAPNIVKSFIYGFPKNWNEKIEKHFVTEEKIKLKANSILKLSTSVQDKMEPEDLLNGTVVGTPKGQFIHMNTLRTTRSGRIVKPILATWAGQSTIFDKETNSMKVVYNTKFAESYFTQQNIQLSRKTAPTKLISKKPPRTSTNKAESIKKASRKLEENKTLNEVAQKSKQKGKQLPLQLKNKDDNLERDVLEIINYSKSTRLRKKTPAHHTCYSSTSRLHMKKPWEETDDTEDNEFILSSPSRLRSNPKSRFTNNKEKESSTAEDISDSYTQTLHNKKSDKTSKKTSIKNKISNAKNEICDSNKQRNIKSKKLSNVNLKITKNKMSNTSDELSDLETQTNIKSKKEPMTKSKSKQTLQSSELESVTNVTNKGKSFSRLKTSKSSNKSIKKSAKKHIPLSVSDSEEEDNHEWRISEIQRLQSALKCISGHDELLWKRLADAVASRTEAECQEFIKSDNKYKSFLQSIQINNTKKPVEITAKKGTMKRRKQIRDFLEQGIGDDQELFDSTPFRAKVKKTVVPRLDNDVFSTEGDFPITPGANYRTPSLKYYQTQFSAKKTPVDYAPSPIVSAINIGKADKVVHHYLKRRKLSNNAKPVKKVTPNPTINGPRTLFTTDIDGSLFVQSDPSDTEDEEGDKDYYMSEELSQ